MEFLINNLLTFILFTPVLAAFIIFLIPRDQENMIRWVAFLLSFLPLVFTLVLWFNFQPDRPGFQFQQQAVWYAPINSSFHLGVDGISLPMVLLTTLLTPLCLLASFSVKDNVKAYMILFFLLEMGMLGVFISLDLLLFFVFWEFGLVPMYFLINQWGSEKGEREIWGGRENSCSNLRLFQIHDLHHGRLIGIAPGNPDDRCRFGHIRSAGALPELEFPDWHAVWPADQHG